MTTPAYLASVVIPAAYRLLPPACASPEATRMLMAIAQQESQCCARRQYRNGPARGFWQFEKGGGVQGTLSHPASAPHVARVLETLQLPALALPVWEALEHNDILAACIARLYLWTDSRPLPTDQERGWQIYRSVWRPGKPHAHTWPAAWRLGWQMVAADGDQ